MMRPILAAATMGLLTSIQACADGARPSSSGDSYDSGLRLSDSGLVRAVDSATSLDAMSTSELPPATELCQGLSHGGELVEEIGVPWDCPEMLGGVLRLGTYDLSQLYASRAEAAEAGAISDGGAFAASELPELDASDLPALDAPDLPALDAPGDLDASDGGSPQAPGESSSFMEPTGRSARITLVIEKYSLRRLSSWSGEQDRAEAFVYRTDGATLSLRSVCPTRGTESTYAYSVVGNNLALLVDAFHWEIYQRRE